MEPSSLKPNVLPPFSGEEVPSPKVPDSPSDPAEVPALAGYDEFGLARRGGMGVVWKCRDLRLSRMVAFKVIQRHLLDRPLMVRRFVEEAQITSQLQHPNIPPVHESGRMPHPDGRYYYVMKWVEGRTLAELLCQRRAPDEDLPRFVELFRGICQGVAHAHGRGVIHRDLKPGNVMVGAFGEVQVLDWGLAKILDRTSRSHGPTEGLSDSGLEPNRLARPEFETSAGSVFGTCSYMAPEQAAGQTGQVDRRSDVFGLGAILCEILTGLPPYTGTSTQVEALAGMGRVSAAMDRLANCRADTELVRLACACLDRDPAKRPASAAVVAEAVGAFQQSVEARLRKAEIERTAAEARAVAEEQAKEAAQGRAEAEDRARLEAEARAQEERRRRRLTLALAAAVLLLVIGGGGTLWGYQSLRQDQELKRAIRTQQADEGISRAMGEGRAVYLRMIESPDLALLGEAETVAGKIAELAQNPEASEPVRSEANRLVADLRQEEQQSRKDFLLRSALLQDPSEVGIGIAGQSGAQVLSKVSDHLRTSFLNWGLDLLKTSSEEAAARIKSRPAPVRSDVSIVLNVWLQSLRGSKAAEVKDLRMAELVDLLDGHDTQLREIRAILSRSVFKREQTLGVLSMALRPVPIPFDAGWGQERQRLWRLAEEVNLQTASPTRVLLNAMALRLAGLSDKGERLLREAIRHRPDEVTFHRGLGDFLRLQRPTNWAAVVECYVAAHALRPELGHHLATALIKAGRQQDGLGLLRVWVSQQPGNADRHFIYGEELADLRYYPEAERVFRAAIKCDPMYAPAHNGLGRTLREQGKTREAAEQIRKAIEISPQYAEAHHNLGLTLGRQLKVNEAMECFKKAITFDPSHAKAHTNLGLVLDTKGDLEGAIESHQRAVQADPGDAQAHSALGMTLQRAGALERAIECQRQAIHLSPRLANAHALLGDALIENGQPDEGLGHYSRALALEPNSPLIYGSLFKALSSVGRYTEAKQACLALQSVLPADSPVQPLVREEVRNLDRLLDMEKGLSSFLGGQKVPNSAQEFLDLAQLCHFQKRHEVAARFYVEAFQMQPGFARDLSQEHRYRAACSAAAAGVGLGVDVGALNRENRYALRQQALRWLSADLTVMDGSIARGDNVRQYHGRLSRWQSDPTLAPLRRPESLADVSQEERQQWQQFWANVTALQARGRDALKSSRK